MLGRVNENARATQWACAASSTMAADRILMLLMVRNKTTDCESAYNGSHEVTREWIFTANHNGGAVQGVGLDCSNTGIAGSNPI
jgi:hypothetical protein